MRTTTRLGLKVWDQNSDKFSKDDLAANWDALEAKLRPTQTGQASITGSWTSTTLGAQTYYYKDVAVTFTPIFSAVPNVTANANAVGIGVMITSPPTTGGVTLRAWTHRNDNPNTTLYWVAVLP
jgi:hypothetical protein